MKTKEQVLYDFWSGFGLPAYEENSVPQSATRPYITYEVTTSALLGRTMLNASLWYRSHSWQTITLKKDEISKYIGLGGVNKLCDGGMIRIMRGTPFAQNMGDSSDALTKRILLTVNVEYITEN